mgnify:CR=1 FL=1
MSLSYRVIARLDVKGSSLIKGVRFEGLRKLGLPVEFAKRYADQGADELLFLHVASLYGKHNLLPLLEETSQEVFVPITAGGGVRSLGDVEALLRAGADKVAINTAALERQELIRECADRFGCQAIVVSIEAKRRPGGWEAYHNYGRDPSGKDVFDWMLQAEELGAGEILLTSIDRDGTRSGPEPGLSWGCGIPVVYSGGCTVATALRAADGADAIAVGTALHYGETIGAFKKALGEGYTVR